MNFYQTQHEFYGGIDLHAKNFYTCVIDQQGHKIGNPHLKWAFSEAAILCKRYCSGARAFAENIERKHSQARSLTLLASKLGRAIYYMLRKQEAFDPIIFQIR